MNREYMKGIAIFVLDLAMELEYQRRHPRSKCIEHGPLDFTFDDEGECVVRHHDGRLGEISIDPDEIVVDVSYRRKELTIRVQSDKRLSPREVMDIIGDFLDYDTMGDEPVREDPPIIQIRESIPPVMPILKWLICAFIEFNYATRPVVGSDTSFENWVLNVADLSEMEFCQVRSEDLSEVTELFFCKVLGNLGFLPQENFDDNVRVVVNVLKSAGALPPQLVPLVQQYLTDEQES